MLAPQAERITQARIASLTLNTLVEIAHPTQWHSALLLENGSAQQAKHYRSAGTGGARIRNDSAIPGELSRSPPSESSPARAA